MCTTFKRRDCWCNGCYQENAIIEKRDGIRNICISTELHNWNKRFSMCCPSFSPSVAKSMQWHLWKIKNELCMLHIFIADMHVSCSSSCLNFTAYVRLFVNFNFSSLLFHSTAIKKFPLPWQLICEFSGHH